MKTNYSRLFSTVFFILAINQIYGQETLFKKVNKETSKVTFRNDITETEELNIFHYDYLYNGGGVGVLDVNNDGLDDIYFGGNMEDDKLYLNKGNMVFEDITKSSGIDPTGWSSGICVFDVNQDGFDDIYVCKSGPKYTPYRHNLLFVNQGDNTFKEEAKKYGLELSGYYTQAAPLDYDMDGDLDLYVMGHPPTESLKVPLKTMLERLENKEVPGDALMRNDNGVFKDVSRFFGIYEFGFGLGLAITDMNYDNYPDVVVANDFDEPDHLFVNQKNGAFEDQALKYFKHTSNYSMGNDVGDINNDGLMDIITVDMAQITHERSKQNMESMSPEKFKARLLLGWNHQYMHNMLQLSTGMGSYQEIAQMAGVAKTDWSWAPLFFDIDGDGWQDLFVSNGYKRDTKNNDALTEIKANYDPEGSGTKLLPLIELIPSENIANYFFRNNKDLTFEDASLEWGVNEAMKSNGAAYADLDNDGDLDLIINNVDEYASIYENTAELGDRTLKVDFSGLKLHEYLGAKICLVSEKGISQFREAFFVRGYQSTVTRKINFFLPEGDRPSKLYITYQNGQIQTYDCNWKKAITVAKPTNEFKEAYPIVFNTLLKDITKEQELMALHMEDDFDAMKRETLLPHKQSMNGPIVKSGDFNNDGLEDLILGSSKGRLPQVFMQKEDGTFFASRVPSFYVRRNLEESDIHVFDLNNDGNLDLLMTSNGYEKENGDSSYLAHLFIGNGEGVFGIVKNAIPDVFTSTSKIIPSDADSDGDLDFLILGSAVPGRYPECSESFFFRNDKGFYKNATSEVFPDINNQYGVWKDGEFMDIDGDSDLDFTGVGEWTGFEVFENDNGVFKYSSNSMLEVGWWNCMEVIDIDNDGDKDILLGNAGLNNKFHPSEKKPLRVYGGDFDGNGKYESVLACKRDKEFLPVRGRECSSGQLPYIAEEFSTYKAFAEADIEDIYGKEKLSKGLSFTATEFASGILMNNEGKYEFKSFPNGAQVSWLRDFEVTDLNNDGRLDIIGVGNHFGAEVETTNYDASVGAVLIQQEDGSFEYLMPYESGLYVHSDSREIEPLKMANGKTAYLISVNNGMLRLFTTVK